MKVIAQHFYGTTEEWKTANPKLYNAVWGFEEVKEDDDKTRILAKLGNGVDCWNDLKYWDIDNIYGLREVILELKDKDDELERKIQEAIRYAEQLADNKLLSPVLTFNELPKTGLNNKISYLCAVVSDTERSGIYKAAAGWTDTPLWVMYDQRIDFVIESELTEAINKAKEEMQSAEDAINGFEYVKKVYYNQNTGDVIVTFGDNTILVFNIFVESLTKGLDYDPVTNKIIILTEYGELQIDVSALIPIYEGHTGEEIQINIASNVISAILKLGAVKKQHLTASLQEEIEGKASITYVDDTINSVLGDIETLLAAI